MFSRGSSGFSAVKVWAQVHDAVRHITIIITEIEPMAIKKGFNLFQTTGNNSNGRRLLPNNGMT